MITIEHRYQPLSDGWHKLDCGGAVEIVKGWPRRVSDCGRWSLNELVILDEASKATGLELDFNSNRSRRWKSSSFLTVFQKNDQYRWQYANVYGRGCYRCSQDVGKHWCTVPEEGRVLLCDRCVEELVTEGQNY